MAMPQNFALLKLCLFYSLYFVTKPKHNFPNNIKGHYR